MSMHLFIRPRLTLAAFALAALCAHAQLALLLKTENTRYLRYEPIALRLQITNLSGNTLTFGGKQPHEQGAITFKVEASAGLSPAQFARMDNPATGLRLAPGETKELRININQFYDMQRQGAYTITAMVSHNRLPMTHVSKPVRVEVNDGAPLLSCSIGMPSRNRNDIIKTLNLTLMRFSDVDQDIYCLRLEDDEIVYSSHRLGDFVNGEKPQMEMDGSNLIHLLLQLRPRIFVYYLMVINPTKDGYAMEVKQKTIYKSADGMPPTLTRDRAAGRIRLQHARRAVAGLDYVDGDSGKDDEDEDDRQ